MPAQKLTVALQKDYFKAKEDGILSFKQESHNSLRLEPARCSNAALER